MSKQDQILLIKPAYELVFHGPFTKAVLTPMTLTNPTDQKVLFKIKTTAPKRYCVKPNAGAIKPLGSVDITVNLQPFEYDPTIPNRHKFMVQSLIVPEQSSIDRDVDVVWREIGEENIMNSKLKCVFVQADGATNSEIDVSSNVVNSEDRDQSDVVVSGVVDDARLRLAMEEIRRLQEELSDSRKEVIRIKENELRRKKTEIEEQKIPVSFSSSTVVADSPDQSMLSPFWVYVAVFLLILGMIIGKWVI